MKVLDAVRHQPHGMSRQSSRTPMSTYRRGGFRIVRYDSGYFACPNNLLNSIIYDLAKPAYLCVLVARCYWERSVGTQKINVYTIDSLATRPGGNGFHLLDMNDYHGLFILLDGSNH